MSQLSTLISAFFLYLPTLLAIGTFLTNCWKLIPVAKRDSFEQKHPQIVGIIRVFVEIFPGVIDAGRALQNQVILGQPKRGPVPETFRDPPQRQGFIDMRILRAISLLCVLSLAPLYFGCASTQGDGMTQLVSGYSTFRSVAARICTVVMALPPPPTPSAPSLDAGGVP